MKELIGVIGGTGLYSMASFKLKKKVNVKTPFGKTSDAFMLGEINGHPVVFLPRHGVGHRLNPTEVPYRANIWGMKKLGVQAILSVSAVGSLKEEIPPGDIVMVDQFFDRTKGVRQSTFFEKGMVGHVSFAEPICAGLRGQASQAAHKVGARVHDGGTYVCMEGPAFSTRAESLFYKDILKADVIGMTNLTEAKLAREAGLCYCTIALSTDYDCWHQSMEPVTTEQIIAVLHQNVDLAQKIVAQTVKSYSSQADCSCKKAAAHAVMTDSKKVPSTTKANLKVVLKN